MRKTTIKIAAAFALTALGNQAVEAQSYGADINQNDGVIIRANNDSSNHYEFIRFQIGGSTTVAEMNHNSFIFNGRAGGVNPVGAHVGFRSNRGIDIYSNADHNNASGENIRFRVGTPSGSYTVAEVDKDGLRIVRLKARNTTLPIRVGSTDVADFSSSRIAFRKNLILNTSSNNRIGIGTLSPETSIHLTTGNVRIDGGGSFQSHGPVLLRPDVDNTSDDVIAFMNSSNQESARIHDGRLRLNTINGVGSEIHSTGGLVLRPDIENNGGDDFVSFRNTNGQEKTRIQDGTITTDRVVLNVGSFPDYVFAKDYSLMPLNEVADYIKENKHLPNMPSEAEVVANGMSLGQINTVLVEKVEELTLHTINQEDKINTLMKELELLKSALKDVLAKQN